MIGKDKIQCKLYHHQASLEIDFSNQISDVLFPRKQKKKKMEEKRIGAGRRKKNDFFYLLALYLVHCIHKR